MTIKGIAAIATTQEAKFTGAVGRALIEAIEKAKRDGRC